METFRTLERQVDFGALAPGPRGEDPLLLIGAVDVLSGAFKAFDSRRDRITAETVLASAAIPTLFRAVRIGDGTYWDGLFSQNPPVRDLTDARPDEIWVIQINPTEAADRAADRRWRSPTAATSSPATSRSTRSCSSSRRSTSCWTRACSTRAAGTGGRRAVIELVPVPLLAAAGARVEAQPRTGVPA